MNSRALVIVVAGALALSGCSRVGESRLNPFNWFGGGSEEERVVAIEEASDPRPLIAEVTTLVIERTPGGAIIRATGLPPQQGWHSGALVPESDGPVNGVLAYRFRAMPPREATRVSTSQSRELSVAVSVSNFKLADTRVILVIGAQNQRSIRR